MGNIFGLKSVDEMRAGPGGVFSDQTISF